MPGQPFSGQNRQNFHRRGAFQAFLCATPGGRRFDAHAGALLYIYAEALILGYSIRGTPRVIRNEKRQIELPRASADSTPILTDQKPSSGSFWTNHGRARVPARRKCIEREHVSARIASRASVSVRGKNAVEMYGPGTLSKGTAAAARFISSMERARPIPKKRFALALSG